ncbi:MAG: TolC family protein [Calditrichaceae bacterium]|nr:TolC family protein [Calditrichaceae bacterium]MBN2709800.1 TolC family protein [Calditrichaceae bacterium]RQV94995.1 MAG: TolC family protein [Calditrichota bacterium]
MKIFFMILWCGLLLICNASLFAQNNLDFDQALDIAREQSPLIKQARLNLERSQQQLNAQQAYLKSRFSLTLEPFYYDRQNKFNEYESSWYYSETKRSLGTFIVSQPLIWTDGTIALRNEFSYTDFYNESSNDANKTYSNNLYLTFDQPFFTYNRAKLELKEIELDFESAALDYKIQELQLEQQVAQAFYRVYQAKTAYQVSQDELKNTENSYTIVKNKVDAGLTAMEELYQAELNLLNSQSTVENNRVSLENYRDQLKKILGLPIAEDIDVITDVTLDTIRVNIDKALEYGLKSRMELRQRDIDIIYARNNVIRAGATNEFRGDLSLRFGLTGINEQVEDIFNRTDDNQSFSLSFNIPLYDWGEKKSRVKSAEATVEQRKISMEEEQREIEISIRSAYRTILNELNQVKIARQNVKVAELTYEINLEKYKNGDLTSMDLNLYQTQLSEKRLDLGNAIISYRLAILDLKIQSLWDFRKDKPVFGEL